MTVIILLFALFGFVCAVVILFALSTSMNCVNIKCRRKGSFDADTPYCSRCGVKNIEE